MVLLQVYLSESKPLMADGRTRKKENIQLSEGGKTMTTLQIEYQKLLETQRANRAKEGLTAQEVEVKQRAQGLAEAKAPYDMADMLASANLKKAQIDQVTANVQKLLADTEVSKATVDKVYADIERIAHESDLTSAQTSKVFAETNKLFRDTELSAANTEKVWSEIARLVEDAGVLKAQKSKIEAETEKLNADTKLTDAQRDKVKAEILKMQSEYDLNHAKKLELAAKQLDKVVGLVKGDINKVVNTVVDNVLGATGWTPVR